MIRVRFAPSPTGHLHIGGLRTALFNWLFARHNGGKFLLRIEDTDLERSSELYVKSILSSLEWCGISFDEPPVVQSQRIDEHRKVIKDLLDRGSAYKCYCSQEEVAQRMGAGATLKEGSTGYDGFCRNRDVALENQDYVVRFKVPEGKLSYNDLIYGEIHFDLGEFDDFVIQRSDGSPTYNFVVVVDDAFMSITHVIRGEDHISNTPKQILLYEACGYKQPLFAHVPLILGPGGHRLSKRDAATSVLDYQKEGFLADALCNYLVRLGWAHGDQEIFTRSQMIEFFELSEVNRSGATFDLQKLLWVNSVYIKEKDPRELLELIVSDIDRNFQADLSGWPFTTILRAIELFQPRVSTLKELVSEIELLYQGPEEIGQDLISQHIDAQTSELLKLLNQELASLTEENWSFQQLKALIGDFCKKQGVGLARVAHPLRLALVGKTAAAGIYELLEIAGKSATLSRLDKFLQNI